MTVLRSDDGQSSADIDRPGPEGDLVITRDVVLAPFVPTTAQVQDLRSPLNITTRLMIHIDSEAFINDQCPNQLLTLVSPQATVRTRQEERRQLRRYASLLAGSVLLLAALACSTLHSSAR